MKVVPLRWRLAMLTLVLVLGLGAVTLVSLWFLMRAQLNAQMRSNVEATRGLIDHILHERTLAMQGEIKLVADLPTIKSAVVSRNAPTVKERLDAYRGKISAQAVVVTDNAGQLLGSTGFDVKADFTKDKAVQKALDGLEWGGVRSINGFPMLVTATPIMVGGYPRGCLMSFRTIGSKVARELRQDLTADVVFIAGSRIVGSSIGIDTSLSVKTDDPVEVKINGQSYIALRALLPDQERGTNASFVVLRNMKEFTEPYNWFGSIFACILALASLTALAAAGRFSRRITDPLESVIGAARVLRSGQWPEQLEVVGDDEIGVLQRTFNDMTKSLKASVDFASRNEELTAALEEAEAANTALKKARKMEAIGILSAGIAHEINTPTQFVRDNIRFLDMAFERMTKCINYVDSSSGVQDASGFETVKKSVRLPELMEEVPRAIAECTDGVDRIVEIVQGLKHYSHPGSGKGGDANLNAVINSCVLISRNEWKYNAKLECDLNPSLRPVNGLAGQIGQVVINLIVNSAHAIRQVGHGPDVGRIWVSTRQEGDFAKMVIKDNGCGITPEIFEQVFEQGFTTKGPGEGCGMGLSLALGIIQDHGGQMNIESSVGVGTSIIIQLPLSESIVIQEQQTA